MGSWSELDAIYPPEALTPAAALLVALGRLAGAESVWVEGKKAAFLPTSGMSYTTDLLERVERYLSAATPEEFFGEARKRLNQGQKICLALNLLDRAMAAGDGVTRARLAQLFEGLDITAVDLAPFERTIALKNDFSIFPQ